MSNIRGIYIDPDAKTVTEVWVDRGEGFLVDVWALCRCNTIQPIHRRSNGRRLYLFCDEEGRLKKKIPTPFAIRVDELNGAGEEIVGPAVLLGPADKNGDTMPADGWCTVESITPLIMWAADDDEEER